MIDQETAFSFQTLTVSTTAVSLTATVGQLNSHRAIITVEDAPIRFRYDGTAPTSSVGHVLYPGDKLILEGRANISQFRAIRSGNVDATLSISHETL